MKSKTGITNKGYKALIKTDSTGHRYVFVFSPEADLKEILKENVMPLAQAVGRTVGRAFRNLARDKGYQYGRFKHN